MEDITGLLADAAISRRIAKRTILLCQGETPRGVSIVRSGCVKVYRICSNGDEKIAGFKTAGDIFPECWAFNHTSSTMYYYESLEDSEIYTVDREAFLEMVNTHPAVKERYFDYMVKNYTGSMIQVSALGQTHAADKILMILYYLMVRHGVEKHPGEFWVLMQLRQATIAGLAGLTRETVTVEMGRLRRQGVVKYDTKSFVIFKEKLKTRLGEDTFLEMQFR